jgi:uncharacterized membrane protein YdjX (TVP38/TMEM64 family)
MKRKQVRSKILKTNPWWKPVVLFALLGSILVLAKVFHLSDQLTVLRDWIKSLGAWGPFVYILLYTLWVVAALPVTLFAFLAGVLFGTVVGVIVANIGATLGACLAFLAGRYFARGAVNQLVKKYENFRKLEKWTADNGIWIVILTRLFPLLPFNLLNYAFGLTQIEFWPYAFWTWLCMIPAIFIYVVGAEAVQQGLAQGRVPWDLVGWVAGVLVFLVLLSLKLKQKTRKLR